MGFFLKVSFIFNRFLNPANNTAAVIFHYQFSQSRSDFSAAMTLNQPLPKVFMSNYTYYVNYT